MKTSSNPGSSISPEAISLRARELWLARGSPEGQDVEIWLEAERQLFSGVPQKEPAKSARKARPSLSEKALSKPGAVDAGELQERLRDFGEPPRRSPTSLDLT